MGRANPSGLWEAKSLHAIGWRPAARDPPGSAGSDIFSGSLIPEAFAPFLVLGLRGGRALGDEKARTEETYAAARSLMERFVAQHGTCSCRELLGGCDLRTDAGQREFKEKGYLRNRCCEYVRTVVALVGEATTPSQPYPGKM